MAGAVSFILGPGRKRRAFIVLLAGLMISVSARANQTECVELAAAKYGLPISLVDAILEVEGGQVGQAVRNDNGTEDLGPMQINTVWLPRLATYGITREQLQNDRCINILVGSWILAQQLETAKHMEGPVERRIWWGIGAYNSGTPQHNVNYALKVWQALRAKPPGE
jgi:soluble lytic murein transglycosylase-like protein